MYFLNHELIDFENQFHFYFVLLFTYLWFVSFSTKKKKKYVVIKISLLIGQVQTKMNLPEIPFFKNSLTGSSELVLMSVPEIVKLLDATMVLGKDLGEHSTQSLTQKDIPKN